ncbi:chaplin [Streptomyces sp. NPDC059071]|uniref:chaplin n=1 Tax=unclassified Streptomyces TaxID=2593676 RepID=UPI00364703E9
MRQVTRIITRKSIVTVAAAGGMIALGGGYAHAGSGASGTASDSPGVASGNTVQAPVHAPVNVCGNTVSVIGLMNPATGNSCANTGTDGSGGYGDEGSSGSSADGHASDSPGVGSGNTVQVPVDAPVNVCGNSVNGVGLGNAVGDNDCGYGVEPTTPGNPGNPGNPGGPGTPGNPGNPGGPGTPGNPGNPGNEGEHPGNPGTPGTPGNPGTPGTPGTPGNEGGHPGNPGAPGTPGSSYGPNTPGTHAVTPSGPTEELAHTGVGPLGLVVPAGAGLLLAGSVIYRRSRRTA